MGYWPDQVESTIHNVQDNFQHVGNEAKADILKERLGRIDTKDAFYIIVYNHCGSYEQHSYNANTNQTIYSFRRGGCCVVVYRSVEMNDGHWQTPDDLEKMEIQVETCRHRTIPYQLDYNGFPGTLMGGRIENTRFVGMIKKIHNPHVRDVNSWKKWGPGWWITATDAGDRKWLLIAGYR